MSKIKLNKNFNLEFTGTIWCNLFDTTDMVYLIPTIMVSKSEFEIRWLCSYFYIAFTKIKEDES